MLFHSASLSSRRCGHKLHSNASQYLWSADGVGGKRLFNPTIFGHNPLFQSHEIMRISFPSNSRLMLSTPREKQIQENNDAIIEEVKAQAANNVVEEVVGTMFQNVETIIKSDEGVIHNNRVKITVSFILGLINAVEGETDNNNKNNSETSENVKAPSIKSSDQISIKISQKEKQEMIKQLPVARQEEFKVYTGQQQVESKIKKSKTSQFFLPKQLNIFRIL